jgi:hypothetical protein
MDLLSTEDGGGEDKRGGEWNGWNCGSENAMGGEGKIDREEDEERNETKVDEEETTTHQVER